MQEALGYTVLNTSGKQWAQVSCVLGKCFSSRAEVGGQRCYFYIYNLHLFSRALISSSPISWHKWLQVQGAAYCSPIQRSQTHFTTVPNHKLKQNPKETEAGPGTHWCTSPVWREPSASGMSLAVTANKTFPQRVMNSNYMTPIVQVMTIQHCFLFPDLRLTYAHRTRHHTDRS